MGRIRNGEGVLVMTHFQPRGVHRIVRSASILCLAAALAACAGPRDRAQTVQEAAPTVTYQFSNDEGLVDATIKAEAYCRDYNAWPTNAGIRTGSRGASEVTFVCDQDRGAAYTGRRPPAMPSDITVDYTYRDDGALINATTQAQRHCAQYGAEARSRTVGTAADGTRTVVFECVRAR